MAAEGGELTFVRCPSCRSLVPAVSTRCRWCGNSLGGSASEAPKDEAPARRVRQKTRSIKAGEYVPQPTREKGAQPTEDSSSEENFDLDDPLKGFIEEVEEVEEEISDEEILSSLAEVEEAEAQADADPQLEAFYQEDDNTPSLSDFEDDGDLQSFVEGSEADSQPVAAGATPYYRDSVMEEPQPVALSEQSVSTPIGPIKSDLGRPNQAPSIRPQPTSKSNQQRAPMQMKSDLNDTGFEAPESIKSRIQSKETRTGGIMNKTHYEAAEGSKLFGWLVSYSTPEGKAFELREGKFFISGNNLKGNDFVVNDPSVSTPHAMVNLTRSGGFAIQDLMSDRGVFIRRRGQETYQREDGLSKCLNGDWIRIGDVEYLLTIVADVVK